MKNRRNVSVLVVLLMAGALIGGILGEVLSQNAYLSWLNLGGNKDLFAFNLHPAINLRVLRFGFDIAFRISIGSILGMILGFLVYLRTR